MSDAVTIVLRYEPVIADRPDVSIDAARELWRDALTREADQLAERHACEVEVHYEDLTSACYADTVTVTEEEQA